MRVGIKVQGMNAEMGITKATDSDGVRMNADEIGQFSPGSADKEELLRAALKRDNGVPRLPSPVRRQQKHSE